VHRTRRPGPGLASLLVLAALAVPPMIVPAAAATDAGRPVAWDSARYIGVDEIRPGMTGWGLTVISGTALDTFRVEVIAVRKNFFPQTDIILARGSGAGMETAGIVAGMSGSPVYIDGRLAGALAYGWPLMKEPIMGITPIEHMLPMTTPPAAGAGDGGGSGLSADPNRREAWRRLLFTRGVEAEPLLMALTREGMSPAAGTAGEWSSASEFGAAGGSWLSAGAAPRRIVTPLWAGGLDPRATGALSAWLEPFGVAPIPAGTSAGVGEGPTADDLVPGASIGLAFATGDVSMTAIGTVTWREGDRLLAFGHPMFQRGRARFPMTTATIETVMPKLDSSFKFGSAARPVGTVDIDLNNGIGGTIGPLPAMVPLTLTIQDDLPAAARTVRVSLLDDEPLLPVLAAISTLNSALAAGADHTETSLELNTRITLADGRSLEQRTMAAGGTPGLSAALALFRSLSLLAANPYERVRVSAIDATLAVRHEVDLVELAEVVVTSPEVLPGGRFELTAQLRAYRGGFETRTLTLDVPPETPPGDYQLRVCDARAFLQWDQGRAPGLYDPPSLGATLDLLSAERPQDTLILTLVRNEPGVTARGRELGRLPASVLSALAAPGVTGPFALTQSQIVARGEVVLPSVVAGCHQLTVRVLPDPRGRGEGGGR
jgi:hypothetical protein